MAWRAVRVWFVIVAAMLGMGRAAAAQAIGLVPAADGLRPRAAGFTFIDGTVLERLRDGRAVRVDLELVVEARGGSPAARIAQTFTLSFDLWEERFAASRVGTPPRATSHLDARAAEAWCVDQLVLPRAALAGLRPGTDVWVRLVSRAQLPIASSAGDALSPLGLLIESLSRPDGSGDVRRTIEAGPLRLPE